METIYKPHHYLLAMARRIPIATVIGSLLCWAPTVLLTLIFLDHLYMPLVRLSLVANLTVFFVALFFSMVLHEICGTTYSISDEGIIKKSPYKTVHIHFENVTRFRYFRFPFIGGFGLIKVPSGSIMIPFITERLDHCIEDIRQRLEACGNQNSYDTGNIEEYKFKAFLNEISVRRMERTIPMLLRITVGSAMASVLIAQVFWGLSFRSVLSWTFWGAVFPIIGYLLAEMLLRYRNLSQAAEDREHPHCDHSDRRRSAVAEESAIYWQVGAITAIVYAIAGIIVKHVSS
jgi:hypothetical protein